MVIESHFRIFEDIRGIIPEVTAQWKGKKLEL